MAYDDKNDDGNGPKYHTGKKCIDGCGRPAGTAWSDYWCFECNVDRMRKINENLKVIASKFGISIYS